MSEDGGPDEQAKLRERFAVAIVMGQYANPNEEPYPADDILNKADWYAGEAMNWRKQDNTKRLAEGAEAMKDEPLYAADEVKNG